MSAPASEHYLATSMQSIGDAISSGDWSEVGAGEALDVLGAIVNPVDALASVGVDWVMENVGPLREALDMLAGDPGAIQGYAGQWRQQAETVVNSSTNLGDSVTNDTASWLGEAADAYRAQSAQQIDGVAAAGGAAEAVARAIETAGQVCAAVRMLVKELIAECVSTIITRLPIWLGSVAASAGLSLPLVIADLVFLVLEFI